MNQSDFAKNLEELRRLRLLQSVDLSVVEPLLLNCPVRTIEPGEILIAAGDPNLYLYLLLSGSLSVHLQSTGSEPIYTLEPGESVGEVSLIDHRPASAYVMAKTPSRILVIDEQDMWMLADTSHAISRNLLSTLTQRLRSGNDLIYQHQAQLGEYQFQATIDAVTGLYNRHWLDKMLPRQIGRSRSTGEPFSVLMLDIDHFKGYNDTYGHLGGDRALYTVACTLRDKLRPADMAARYGGEEFVVLLPQCGLGDACNVAERLRIAVAESAVIFPQGPELPAVTMSLGAAELVDTLTRDELLAAADAALYRAKHDGRNRVAR
jgi:diguanylate cyclase (GGDEF)-like protein